MTGWLARRIPALLFVLAAAPVAQAAAQQPSGAQQSPHVRLLERAA